MNNGYMLTSPRVHVHDGQIHIITSALAKEALLKEKVKIKKVWSIVSIVTAVFFLGWVSLIFALVRFLVLFTL